MQPADLAFATRLFGCRDEARLALLRAIWPAAVGQRIAARTEVVSLSGAFLRVCVADARWTQVLRRMQGQILSRLRRAAGGLAPDRLAFFLGPPAVATPAAGESADAPASRAPAPPEAERPSPAIEAAAEAIADPVVRQAFTESAARYLRRTRLPGAGADGL